MIARSHLDTLTGHRPATPEKGGDIYAVMLRRERAVSHLRGQLATVQEHVEWSSEYRREAAAQLVAEIQQADDQARRDLRASIETMAAAPRARVARGVEVTADEMAQAQLLRSQYAASPRRLMGELESAIASKDLRRARVAWAAAVSAELPGLARTVAGPSKYQDAVMRLDPETTRALDALDVLAVAPTVLESDIARDHARALPAGSEAQAKASIRSKALRQQLGLPGTDQGSARELLGF